MLCDWSARDLQKREQTIGLGPAKGKDSATSLGPVLVTPDELEPYRSGSGYKLAMSCTVNGQHYGGGNWSDIYWSFGQMMAYASRGTHLRPGDVIGSGTVGTGVHPRARWAVRERALPLAAARRHRQHRGGGARHHQRPHHRRRKTGAADTGVT